MSSPIFSEPSKNSTSVIVPSKSVTAVVMFMAVPSSKEAPSLGDVMDIDGAEFPVSETMTNTSSVALYNPSLTVNPILYTPSVKLLISGEAIELSEKLILEGP